MPTDMRLEIEVKVRAFTVPNHINISIHGNAVEDTHIPLSEFKAKVLERMCDDFRDEIFKKAGKTQPPVIAPLCSKCGVPMR